MRALLMLLATTLPAAAQSFSPSFGAPRQYPYPAEPQYQYPVQTERPRAPHKCPKGQALFQGKCRIVRPVY